MRRAVLLSITAGFLFGVALRSLIPVPSVFLVALLSTSAIAVGIGVIWYDYKKEVFVFTVCILMIVLGVVRMDVAQLQPDELLAKRIDTKVELTGRVAREPDVRERSTRLTVDVERIGDQDVGEGTRVLVVAPPFSTVQYGDSVRVLGTLRMPETFESGEGRVFNYPAYLASHSISYEVRFAQIEVRAPGGNWVVRGVLGIKSAYINGLRAVLPEPYAGLAAGITAGDKRSVGSDMSETFQNVSLIHILVLSGYNITVVLSALMALGSRFSRGPQLALVLLVITFFMIISGGASSAARAGAMAFAAVFAKLYGRQFLALRILVLIALTMVVWNPYVLLFDPGFQLSVLATLGLIVFAPHFEHWLQWIPSRLSLREIASATCATQLMVLPLLLYQNGTLSIVALPANLLALIAVPFAMAFSAFAALAGIVFGTWGTVFALPAYVLLSYIVKVAELLNAVPFSSISLSVFSVWFLVPAYASIAYFVFKKLQPEVEPPAGK